MSSVLLSSSITARRGLKHPKWRLLIVRSSDYAVFRPVFRAGSGACLKLQKSQVWDKTLGRAAGTRWVPARGKEAARAGTLRRSIKLSRAVCGRTRPAPCMPGSPTRASGQSRRTRRGCGAELLPPWQHRGPSDGSGSPSM
ncbi:hypothetical protein NDU88_003862 [Pleurodeles waltl]|uniref:Uncharacterized protein n=1 Tax=Pleurodeles waltl TaxID=8319 RepID=A0AAV7TQB4_PLEWA|nr:hypothetical protein NDU88_003862 [Pleurodeles waltl]